MASVQQKDLVEPAVGQRYWLQLSRVHGERVLRGVMAGRFFTHIAAAIPSTPSRLALHIASALLASVSMQVHALEYAGQVEGGITHTDNSLQTQRNELSDREFTLGSELELAHQGGRVNFIGQYDFEHTQFDRNTQSTSNELNGNSQFEFALLPEMLNWQLRHSRSNERTDTREADISDNRETREIIGTGPQLRLPVSDHDFLNISAEQMQVRNQVDVGTDNDSSRQTGNVGWTRLITPRLDLSLDVSRQDVDFDQQGQTDLQTERAGISAVQRYRLGRVEASIGRNRTTRDQGDDVSGGYYRAYADLNAAGHSFSLAGTQELTDSALGLDTGDFGLGQGDGIVPDDNFDPRDPNFDVIDIVERRSIELNYRTVRVCDRCEVSLSMQRDEQDFDITLEDEVSQSGSAGLDYRWSENFETSVNYTLERTDYTDDPNNRQDDIYTLALEAGWQFARSWWLVGTLESEERDSSEVEGDYTENRVGLALRYTFEQRDSSGGR